MFNLARKDPARLSFDQLLDMKKHIDAEIAKRHGTEIETLKTKLTAMAATLGISLAELFGIKGEQPVLERRSKRHAKIKYRDPEQPENTLTGKGRPPKWMQTKIDQGGTKEQFQIQ